MPEPGSVPSYLSDRGVGTPTSMFGTYLREGELLVYPFYEYYKNADEEYSPDELGFGLDEDFTGDFTQSEWLIFLGYGLTANLALEFEAVLYTEATQKKSGNDPTDMPDELSESGSGDTQMQLNWNMSPETASAPGYFSFLEIVFPLQKDKVLIGTSDWEVKVGAGIINGFNWGTLTGRMAMEYDRGESKVDAGEFAVEYLKLVASALRVYLGVEGNQDEVEMITEVQWHFSKTALFKFNNAFGLTPKAPDWAPEIGVMMSF